MVSITPPVADMVKADGVEPNADGTDLTVLPADYDFPKADAAFASHAGMRAHCIGRTGDALQRCANATVVHVVSTVSLVGDESSVDIAYELASNAAERLRSGTAATEEEEDTATGAQAGGHGATEAADASSMTSVTVEPVTVETHAAGAESPPVANSTVEPVAETRAVGAVGEPPPAAESAEDPRTAVTEPAAAAIPATVESAHAESHHPERVDPGETGPCTRFVSDADVVAVRGVLTPECIRRLCTAQMRWPSSGSLPPVRFHISPRGHTVNAYVIDLDSYTYNGGAEYNAVAAGSEKKRRRRRSSEKDRHIFKNR